MGIFWPADRQEIQHPSALIFDMDGVLIDSEGLHERAKRRALLSAGINVDEALLSRYTGRSDRAMITEVARSYGRSDSDIETILAEKSRLYALGARELVAVPGAIDFLHWAHGRFRLEGNLAIGPASVRLLGHRRCHQWNRGSKTGSLFWSGQLKWTGPSPATHKAAACC
jgi:hypothetical protein